MATLEELGDQLNGHEKDCIERNGEVNTRFAKLEVGIAWLTRIVWAVLGTILAFELNALFKLVGH